MEGGVGVTETPQEELDRLTRIIIFQTDVRLTIACLPETDPEDQR